MAKLIKYLAISLKWGSSVVGMSLLLLFLLSVIPRQCDIDSSCDSEKYKVFVVDHGYHTAVVVPVVLDTFDWRARLQFDHSVRYIEFAWGDQAYYTSPAPSLWTATRALFWPSASVMHVVGVGSPRQFFASQPVYELTVCRNHLHQLNRFLISSFADSDDGKWQYLQPGLYGNSAFYRARYDYHFLYNCNNWTAGALRTLDRPTVLWNGLAPSVTLYLPE